MRGHVCSGTLLALALAFTGCATNRATVNRAIYEEGPNAVKLITLRTPEGEPAMRFDHPVSFDAADLRFILGQFTVARKRVGGYAPPEPVFGTSAQQVLAPHLARAFNEADSTEYVGFKVTVRVPSLLLPKYATTAGTMFVRDDAFHLQLEYFEAFADEMDRISYRPDRRTLRDAAQLEVGPDMHRVSPDDGGPPYGHWVAVDWSALQRALETQRRVRARRTADREHRRNREEDAPDHGWETFEGDVTFEDAEPSVPAAPMGAPDTEHRLERARDLWERGLMTDEEYAATRRQILEDL